MKKIPLLVALFSIVSCCHAWWDGGHKAIAVIAYEKLTVEERAWVMGMMEAHPTKAELFEGPLREELGTGEISPETRAKWFFAQASVWSDLIRKREGYPNSQAINAKYHHSGWHYTDLAVFPDERARQELKQHDVPPPMDWTPSMAEPQDGFNSMHTLGRVIHELGDPAVSASDKAVNICWLFHCLGDTHQPCHCAQLFVPKKLEDGDRGGNRILVLGIKRANPELDADVLHYFWDSLWNGEKNGLKEIEERIFPLKADATLWQRAEAAAQITDPRVWLKEGHALAAKYVYSPALLQRLASVQPRKNPGQGRPEDVLMLSLSTLTMDAYIRDARFISRQQIVTAGVRLAAVLRQCIAASKR